MTSATPACFCDASDMEQWAELPTGEQPAALAREDAIGPVEAQDNLFRYSGPTGIRDTS